jgi:hypothetical protein
MDSSASNWTSDEPRRRSFSIHYLRGRVAVRPPESRLGVPVVNQEFLRKTGYKVLAMIFTVYFSPCETG